MSVLKQYNEATSAWEPVVIGKQGNSGVVSVQSPLTNSGTANAAVLGLDANAFSYGQNFLINGGFDIWQRGTTLSNFTGITYLADRWNFQAPAGTVSRVASALTGFEYAVRSKRTSGSANTSAIRVSSSLESKSSIPLAGKTLTFSFYARAGSDFSAASKQLTAFSIFGTGVDQNLLNGLSSQTNLAGANTTLTTSWQRFSYTGLMPTNATQLGVDFYYIPVGTAGADDWFEITGVQLEAGTVATPFKRNAPSIQAELAACQRYFYRLAASQGGPYCLAFMASWENSTAAWGVFPMPVPMRTNPSFSYGGAWNVNYGTMGTIVLDTNQTTPSRVGLGWNNGSGGTNGYSVYIRGSNSASAYMDFNAEL